MIKVGFLGHTLHCHSVGYLCRHLLAELDQSRIQPCVYRLGQAWEDSVSLEISRAIAPSGDSRFYNVHEPGDAVMAIAEDGIDILIDRGSSRVDLQACKLGTGRRFTTS
jgi:Predicted O-linked N-acetylglucosamine transferase, SPINDLY family